MFKLVDIDIHKTSLISPISDLAILLISGDDACSFLNGQFTNDLNNINNGSAQLSAWSDHKGRVITNFIIIYTGEKYILLFNKEQKQYIKKRLAMFVLRAKVSIEDVTEKYFAIGIANKNNLALCVENEPTVSGEISIYKELIIVCHPDNSGRYILIAKNDILLKKQEELESNFSLCESSIWRLLDIFSSTVWINPATQEKFLPQMLNIDESNGLSYQKGCYLGQEVIARYHYKATIKKQLKQVKSKQILLVADNVYLHNSNNKAGTIINSENYLDGFYHALVVLDQNYIDKKLTLNEKDVIIL